MALRLPRRAPSTRQRCSTRAPKWMHARCRFPLDSISDYKLPNIVFAAGAQGDRRAAVRTMVAFEKSATRHGGAVGRREAEDSHGPSIDLVCRTRIAARRKPRV